MKLGSIKIWLLAGCLPLFTGGVSSAAEVVIDSTAAVVNNSVILESELDQAQANLEQAYRSSGTKVDSITARRNALEALINRSLILQLAKNSGTELNDLQVDQALSAMAARNNTTEDKILNSFGAKLSKAQQREAFKEEFTINEVRRSRVRSKINISESEVNSLASSLQHRKSVEPYYHLSQLTIPLSSNPTPTEYAKAQQLSAAVLKAAKSGEDFNALAAAYSASGSSIPSGDLGYLPETQVPLPVIPALLKAKRGDILGPFRSASGLHILKLYDVTQNAVAPVVTFDAAHILLKTSIIFSDDAAKSKLEDLRNRILNGSISFANAAKEYSEDPGSAVNGGDLGYSVPDRYDPEFARAMVSLKVGEISKPVRSAFGWHLILLKDKKTDNDSTAAYRDRARNIIFEREFKEAAAVWERNLRENAYIHVIDPTLVGAGINLNKGRQN